MKFEKNPENKYRSVPFWSLNGKLSEAELKAQIAVLKEMGFGGAFIHSRTGLVTEYMSDEWLSLVKSCSDEMARLNLDAWLYDEDRWPSGTCGGYVTENPKYRRAYLSAKIEDRESFDLSKCGVDYIASFAIALEGDGYTVRKEDMPEHAGKRLRDYFPVTHASQIPDGYLAMTFTVELMEPSEFYNGYSYVDTLAPEPTEKFIELTHEKYREKMGGDFGSKIKGIFTDEPHHGAEFNAFSISNKNGLCLTPYTPKLFDEYYARFKERLEDKLPELYFATVDDNFSEVSWKYNELLEELFLRNFMRPIYSWCKRNNLIFTGHMLHENALSCQVTMQGSAMRFYEYMEYPGIDILGTDDDCYQAAIAVSSVAKQLGKRFVLSELYGCTGWKTTFEQYKQIGDWQALLGINLRCPHLSWYTMKGEAKRDYPASINKQANWFREYRAVEDYFARINKTLTECAPLSETLVIIPVESAWGLSRMGVYYDAFGVRDEEYAKLEKDFYDLTRALSYGGVDFDYGDEEIMARKSRVGKDKRGAFVSVGKMKYREIVIPTAYTLRSETVNTIAEFVNSGGKVYALGALPERIDGVKKNNALVKVEVLDLNALVKKVGHTGEVKLMLSSGGNFIYKLKKAGKDEYVGFIVSADRSDAHSAEIVLSGEYNVEKFDLRSGETVGINYTYENGNTVIKHDFDISEELMLHFTRKPVVKACVTKYGKTVTAANVPMKYSLSKPNVLVLDRAKAYVSGEFFREDELLRIDWFLRDKFCLDHRTGEMIQPWYKNKFYKSYERKVCSLKLEFEFEVEHLPGEVSLMTECLDFATLKLNGLEIGEGARVSEIDECYSVLPVKLAKGKNVLTAEFEFSDSTDIENMFLLGDFGVKTGKVNKIVPLPEKITFGDLCTQGLPFYMGDVTYLIELPDGEYLTRVSDHYAACLKTREGVHAFAPYEFITKAQDGKAEITATLTPKNAFGPLHEVPAVLPICGPGDWHTAGEAWSDDYSLLPQGIFAPPEFTEIKK